MSDEEKDPPVKRSPRRKRKKGSAAATSNVVQFPGTEPEPEEETVEALPRREQFAAPGDPKDAHKRPRDRVNLGQRWSELYRRVEAGECTWEDIADSMDDEELARRQFRDKNNNFSGRPPKSLPTGFVQACDSILAVRGTITWKKAYPKAVEEIARIALYGGKDADRLKALDMIVQRMEGKVPDRLIIAATSDPWETLLAGAVEELNPEEEAAVARAHQYAGREAPEQQ